MKYLFSKLNNFYIVILLKKLKHYLENLIYIKFNFYLFIIILIKKVDMQTF